MILAWLFGPNTSAGLKGIADVFSFWELGFWDLLGFSMQMVLILFLGYMLALTPLLNRLSDTLARLTLKPARIVLLMAFSALVLGFLNWGLALVFGAVFVRKIGDAAQRQGIAIPYPLLGATAYVCMMVWHGGLSASAPLSVAESSHFLVEQTGVISINETVFSKMNLWAWGLLLAAIPVSAMIMLRNTGISVPDAEVMKLQESASGESVTLQKNKFGLLSTFGLIMLGAVIINRIYASTASGFGLNDINLILLSLVFVFAGSVQSLYQIASKAIVSTIGIVIQFPLYAGIMGIVKYSGLLLIFTQWFSDVANEFTFPLLTMVSAGFVNLFVPSGGGQWAVQGPLIIETARLLDVPFSKAVMALAYGDQLTNMLQPFWALPLLGITGLKASEIVRYTIVYMIVGVFVFGGVLLLF
jgi:short-chain fatty acids transporter